MAEKIVLTEEGTITINAEGAMGDLEDSMRERVSREIMKGLIKTSSQALARGEWDHNKRAGLTGAINACSPGKLKGDETPQRLIEIARDLCEDLPSHDEVEHGLWELMMDLAQAHVYAPAYIERALNSFGVPEAKDEDVSLRVRILRQLLAVLPKTKGLCSKELAKLPIDQVTEECFRVLDGKDADHESAKLINKAISKPEQDMLEEEYLRWVYPHLMEQLRYAGPKKQQDLLQIVGASDVSGLQEALLWCANDAECFTRLQEFWNKSCTVLLPVHKQVADLLREARLTKEEFNALCTHLQGKSGTQAITMCLLEQAQTYGRSDIEGIKAAMRELTGIYYRTIIDPQVGAVFAALVKLGRDPKELSRAVMKWKGYKAAARPDKWSRLMLEALHKNDKNGYQVLWALTEQAVQAGAWMQLPTAAADEEMTQILHKGMKGQVRLILVELAVSGGVDPETAMGLLEKVDENTALALYRACAEQTVGEAALSVLKAATDEQIQTEFGRKIDDKNTKKLSYLDREQRLLLHAVVVLCGTNGTKIADAASYLTEKKSEVSDESTYLKRLAGTSAATITDVLAQLLTAVAAGDLSLEQAAELAQACREGLGFVRICCAWMGLLDKAGWDELTAKVRSGSDLLCTLLQPFGCGSAETYVLEQQLQLLGVWKGAPKVLEKKLLERQTVSKQIKKWSASVAKDRGKEVQHYKSDARFIGCAEQLASGRIYTGGSSSENLYLLAFALDFTYHETSNRKNNIRCLFEDYQTSNLLRYAEDGNSRGEQEPCVYINKKNYAEVIYLYYLCSNEGTPGERFGKAFALIDRLTKEPDSGFVKEDQYNTEDYHRFFDDLLDMDEAAMELFVRKNYARSRKDKNSTRGAIEMSRSARTEKTLYERAVAELRAQVREEQELHHAEGEEPIAYLRRKAERSCLAERWLLDHFVDGDATDEEADPEQVRIVKILRKILNRVCMITAEEDKTISRTDILVTQFWNAFMSSKHLPCESLSNAFKRLSYEANEMLESSGYPTVMWKSFMDVLLCFLLYLLINSAPLFSEGQKR